MREGRVRERVKGENELKMSERKCEGNEVM